MSYLQNNKSKNPILPLIPVALLVCAFLFTPDIYAGGKKKNKKGKNGSCKSDKPNIVCSKPPKFKTRGAQYAHAMSKKKVKGATRNSTFSYTQPRYNLFPSEKKKGKNAKAENNGRQVQQ